MRSEGKATLALTCAALMWGSGGLGIKLVDLPPMAITGARSAIAALVLLAALRALPALPQGRAAWGAAVSYACMLISNVAATKLTTAANAILLAYAAPVYVALLAPRFLGERTRPGDWAFVGAIVGGMVLFFCDKLTPGGLWGNIIAMGTGLSYAAFTMCMRAQKDAAPLESVLWGHVLTAACGLPFLLGQTFSQGTLLGLGYLGVVQQGLSLLLYVYGVKRLGALRTILIMTLEPILNPLLVAVFHGEIPGVWSMAGGALVLGAVILRAAWSALRNGPAPRDRAAVS